MMRFPPRLAWDLARVRIAQKLFGATRRPLVLQLDLADSVDNPAIDLGGHAGSTLAGSSVDSQVLARVRSSAAPFVWIGGAASSQHPRIGQIARDIVKCGKIIFIETDGSLLRRRIHEFTPVSQLYLVLPLHGLEATHDLRARQAGNFRATLESIRTARLSGFHICVETAIVPDSELSDLRKLAEFISTLAIDGWIQKSSTGLDAAAVPEQKLAAARELIPSKAWQRFSQSLSAQLSLQLCAEPLGAPHAVQACGEVDNLTSTASPNSTRRFNHNPELPSQKESAAVR